MTTLAHMSKQKIILLYKAYQLQFYRKEIITAQDPGDRSANFTVRESTTLLPFRSQKDASNYNILNMCTYTHVQPYAHTHRNA